MAAKHAANREAGLNKSYSVGSVAATAKQLLTSRHTVQRVVSEYDPQARVRLGIG